MRKSALMLLFVVVMAPSIAGNASAAIRGELTLSLSGGYTIILGGVGA